MGNDNRLVMVVGLGRCGSSAIAHALHEAGLPFEGDLIGPHPENNPHGHYEDRRLWTLERQLYRSNRPKGELWLEAGLPEDDGVHTQGLALAVKDRIEYLKPKAVNCIKSTFLHCVHDMLGIIFEPGDVVIEVTRDTQATLQSRVDKGSPTIHQMEWEDYIETAEGKMRSFIFHAKEQGAGHIFIDYDVALAFPRGTMHMIKELVVPDDKAAFIIDKAVDALDPTLNHYPTPLLHAASRRRDDGG